MNQDTRSYEIKLPDYRYCNRHGEPRPCHYCRLSHSSVEFNQK